MFDHPVNYVGLGLIFFYVVLSLVASAVQEWIANLFALCSRNLQRGYMNIRSQRIYRKTRNCHLNVTPETLTGVLLEVTAK